MAAIAATTVTVRIVFISLVIETGLEVKGPIYPKRNRQESSKTFHKSLGRKITSNYLGPRDVVQARFLIFSAAQSHSAPGSATAASHRWLPPIRHRS